MKLLALVLCLIVFSCGCIAQQGFDAFADKFVKGYNVLKMPQLQLSYVENLKQLPAAAEAEKQKVFFERILKDITAFNKTTLTTAQQTDYDLIVYESTLSLEELTLVKTWHVAKQDTIPATGLYTLPNGRQWYAWFLKKWVADNVTPDGIYAFGMEEVGRVKQHIKDIQVQSGMDEDKFYAWLNDSSFFQTNPEQIQQGFERVKKTVLQNMPIVFNVQRVPNVAIKRGANQALAQTPGYYNGNTFYYNLFDKPYNKRQYDWLFIHEAVPGHHYQSSIAGQLKQTSVHQLFYYLGFSEGWGAYVEYLGRQLGVYKTMYDELGKWEWDIVRSVRVPLDVGINYYGWTDEQALAFWKQNIRGQDAIAMREINRIKRWPAQVVTYKYGAARIMQWKEKLQQQQGGRFDIKAFHDRVLNHGALPFFILEKYVMR